MLNSYILTAIVLIVFILLAIQVNKNQNNKK